ncbi:hypothetical protein [Longimicrobium sp.]|uniref:hypothetical protein n=1 Tax=Longimicrobium sp. TaxID=2029185 RepID=UPI003B3A2B59
MGAVTILNSAQNQQEVSASGVNSAQARLQIGPYAGRAMVLITASGWAHYKGTPAGAGILLTLKVGGNVVAQDDSFEGESSNIGFMASAAHNFFLRKGQTFTIEATVEPRGSGGARNTNAKVNLSCFALQAELAAP